MAKLPVPKIDPSLRSVDPNPSVPSVQSPDAELPTSESHLGGASQKSADQSTEIRQDSASGNRKSESSYLETSIILVLIICIIALVIVLAKRTIHKIKAR